jgi:hypothetical protein
MKYDGARHSCEQPSMIDLLEERKGSLAIAQFKCLAPGLEEALFITRKGTLL